MTGDTTLLGPYRVLDLADEQGALCGRIFATMGADVIKVEPPAGLPARRRGPFYRDVPDPERSLSWWALEANKRGVTINLENADGRAILRRLVESADFLVESFVPGYLDGLGIGYDALHALNPRLIFVSITPFGSTGPHSRWAANDLTIQAMSGHMYLNGEPDRAPVRLGVAAAYWHGGAEGAEAALIANHYRRRTGNGQRVDISMQQCHIWTLLNTTMTWQLVRRQEIRGGARRKERGNDYYSRHLWPCKDGAVHFIPIGGGGGTSRQLAYLRLVTVMKAEEVLRRCARGARLERRRPLHVHASRVRQSRRSDLRLPHDEDRRRALRARHPREVPARDALVDQGSARERCD